MNVVSPVAGPAVRTADLRDQGERKRIESFIDGHAEAEPCHRPQLSLAVERCCGQRSHYLLVEDRSGILSGLLPLTEVRSALFGTALVSTGFGVGGGILALDDASGEALAEGARTQARRLQCPTVELRGGYLPAGWSRREGVYASFSRDLAQDDEEILLSIPRKQRAEVRRALGFELDVSVGRETRDHYRVYSESVHNPGTPVFPRAFFEAMLADIGRAHVRTPATNAHPISLLLL